MNFLPRTLRSNGLEVALGKRTLIFFALRCERYERIRASCPQVYKVLLAGFVSKWVQRSIFTFFFFFPLNSPDFVLVISEATELVLGLLKNILVYFMLNPRPFWLIPETQLKSQGLPTDFQIFRIRKSGNKAF